MEPIIQNINMEVADTEYSCAIPANSKRILIKTRNGLDDLKLSYEQGQSGTTYVNIPTGATKAIDNTAVRDFSNVILYFQSSTPDVVEIETWR